MEEALMHYVLSLEEVMKMQCVPQYMQQKQHCLNTINMTTTGFLDWLPMQRPPNNSSKRQKGTFSLQQFGQSPRFLDKENLVNSQSVRVPFPEYSGTISGSELVEKSGRIFGHASSFRQQQQDAPSDFFAAVGSKETGGELACQKRRTLRRRGGPEVVSQRLLLETEESSWDCIQQERERENVCDEGKDMDNPIDLVHTPAVSSSVTTARRGGIKRDRKAASGARPVTRASRRLACSSAKQDEAHGELQEESVAATAVNVAPRKAPPHLKNQTGRKKAAILLTPVEEPEVKTRNAEPMNTGSSDADGDAQLMAAGTQMREAVFQVPQFRAVNIDEDSILNRNSDAAAPKSGIVVADVQKKQPLKKTPLCGENISAAILEELTARVMCPSQKNMAIFEEFAAGEPHNVRQGLAWEKSDAMLTGEPLVINKYGHRGSNIVQEEACPPVSQAQGGEVWEKLMVGEVNREVVQVSGALLSSAMESCRVRKDPIFNCRENLQLSGSTVGNSKELKCANFVRQSRAAEQFGLALAEMPSGNIDHYKIEVSPSDLHPQVNESETGVTSNKPENRGMVGQIERSPIHSPAELAHMSRHTAPEASLACARGGTGVEVAGFVYTGAQELKKSAVSLTVEDSGFQLDSGGMEVPVTRNTLLEYEEAKECGSEKTVLVKPGVSSVHGIISQTGDSELDQVPDRDICLASKDREAPMVEDEEKVSPGDPECHELKDIKFEAELLLKQQQSQMQLSTDDGKLIPFTLPENCEALDASPDVGRQDVQFQQEVNPECIVTLDCCHYQKRLSPRSKARARRWQSDLGLSGKGPLRSVVFTDTPERILPVHRDCADMVECGVCSPPLQEKAKVSLTPTFMEVSYQLEPNSQQKPQQASERHLYKEAFSQEFQDGDPDTDDYKDHELLESSAADKQHESSTCSPLLMSINSLTRVSQDRLSSALDFVQKPEQEELEQSCRISAELSVEKVLPATSASRAMPSGASISRVYKSDNPCASNPFTIQSDLPTSRFVHMLPATQDLVRPVHPDVVRLPAIPTMHTACTNVSKSTFSSPIVSTPSSPHPVIFREPSPELNLPKAVDMNVAVINLPHLSSVFCSQARVDPAPSKPFSSISPTSVPSSLADLTVCLEQVTVAAVSANLSPRSPKTLASTYSPAFSRSVDHHKAGRLQTRPEAVSNAVGHSPLIFGDTSSMVPRQLGAARFLKVATTNESYELVPQEMSTEVVVTCKPSDTLIQKRSTKDGEDFATHRTSSLVNRFETSEMVAEALLSVLPSSPMHEDYACAPPKGIRRVNDKDNLKHVSQASSKEDEHTGQLCNTLRQEYPSVSPHVCVQSFSVESFKDDFKGSCRVPDRVVEEAARRISNLTSPATKAGLADCNGAAFPCPMDSLNPGAPLPVLSCPKEGAQKLLSSEVSSSFQVQSLQKSFPSEPLEDIAEKQRFFFNTPESDTSMKLARHASSKFPGMLAHKISSSESCSLLGQVPRPHAWSNLVHMDSAGGTTAVTVAPISVSDGATNPLSKHPNLPLPKHSPQSEYCGSLVGAAFCGNSSSSNLLGSNLVSSMRSFLPLIQQQQIQQQQIQYATGKHDVKVKALEAAEAAKRQEEQRMEERQARKKAMEFAKKAKERTIQEKMKEEQALLKKEIQEKSKAANEILRQKGVSVGTVKTLFTDTSSKFNSNNHGTLSKVKRVIEMRSKLEENREKLQEERRRKEENWKRKELESAAHKQRQEMTQRKEREEKRKRQEAAMKWHRPIEKRHQPELEKENKPQSMGVHNREIRVTEEVSQSNQMDYESHRAHEHRCKINTIGNVKTEEWLQTQKVARITGSLGQACTGLPKDSLHSILPLLAPRNDGHGTGMTLLDGRYLQSAINRPSRPREIGPPMRVLRATAEGLHGGQGNLLHTPPDFCTLGSSRGIANPDKGMEKFNCLQSQMSAPVQGSLPLKDCKGTTLGPTGISAGQPLFCGLTEETFPKSYEMSPYQDSSEGEDSQDGQNRVKKEIPQWARSENLTIQLTRQLEQDPDEIFSGAMSCSLSEVFGTTGSHKRPEFIRRGSSGDWDKDRVTWQEKIRYKMSMGYLH